MTHTHTHSIHFFYRKIHATKMAVWCHLTCGFVGFRWTNGRSWVMATWNTSSYWRMPHIHPGIRSCSWDFPRKNMLVLAKDYGRGHSRPPEAFFSHKGHPIQIQISYISIHLYIYCMHRNASKWRIRMIPEYFGATQFTSCFRRSLR